MGKVRAILRALANPQLVNGPPGKYVGPTPPPTPNAHPLYFNVSGAGDAAWNGQYKRAGDYETGALYESTADACTAGRGPNQKACSLYAQEGVWQLASLGVELFYSAGRATGGEPPVTEWHCDNGSAPAPTLVAGPI